MSEQQLKLPFRLVSRRDVLRAAEELETLRDQLIAAHVKGENKPVTLNDRVKELLEANNVAADNSDTIDNLKKQLEQAVDRLPTLRFTFAAEPSSQLLGRLVEWIRTEIHPAALIIYHVQPQIAGGFILTTDKHRYDHSWRAVLANQPLKLREALNRAG